jgi:hypothetical protein
VEFQRFPTSQKEILMTGLKKVDLGLNDDGDIFATDANRWGRVSQITRPEVCLPSTSNAIGSRQGDPHQTAATHHPF